MTPSRFIKEYEELKTKVWSIAPTAGGYAKSVYTTWEMSFKPIDEDENDRMEKGQILTMLSFLDFRSISQEIYKTPRRLAYIPTSNDLEPPKWLWLFLTAKGEWDWRNFEGLSYVFEKLSLIQLSRHGIPGIISLSIHPLVSEWMKDRVEDDIQIQCLLQAIAIVNMFLRAKLEDVERTMLSPDIERQIFQHHSMSLANVKARQMKIS
jgi:hypothetical protein